MNAEKTDNFMPMHTKTLCALLAVFLLAGCNASGESDESAEAEVLSKCETALLNEPRVMCLGEPFYGNHAEDSEEFVTFIPPVTGHYTIELFPDVTVPDDNTETCEWTMHREPDESSTRVGRSAYDGIFCGVEDVTGSRLSADETYYVRPRVTQDDAKGPPARFKLRAVRVSEGKKSTSTARKLPLNESVSGRVGVLIGTTTASYYRFTAGEGAHEVTVSGFTCGTGGAMRVELYENDFNNRLARDWSSGQCAQSLSASLDPGQEYYLKVENYLGGFSSKSTRPAPGYIGFSIAIRTN